MKIGKPKFPPKPKPQPQGVEDAPRRRQVGDPVPEGYVRGRPSAYRPEYCDALIKYFAKAEPWTAHLNNSGSVQIIPVDKTPSFQRFAVNLGVSTVTLYKWAAEFPEFKEAMEIARDAVYDFRSAQGSVGIGSMFNRSMLACEHGLIEPKQEIAEVKPIEIRIVDAVREEHQ